MLRRLFPPVAAVVCFIAACGAEPERVAAGPTLAGLPTWTLGDTPDVIVGGAASAGATQLGRVVGARLLSDGSIVVSDAQAAEVLRFDSSGEHAETVGRSGSGPAEFRSPGPPRGFGGDSFFIADLDQQRITVFDGLARPVGSRLFMLRTGSGVFAPVGMTAADRFVGMMVVWTWPERPGHRVRTSAAVVTGQFGRPAVDTISAGHGDELIGGIWREGGQSLVVGYPVEFGSTTQVAVSGQEVYVGETRRPEVKVFDLSGRLLRRIVWSAEPDPVTEADRLARIAQESALVASGPGDHPDQRNSPLEHLRTAEFAVAAPTFTGLLPADDRSLWIERDPRPWTPTREYLVFDSTGAAVARVGVPRAFLPYHVTATQAVGRWRESDGAEQVRVYRLVR